MSCRTTSAGSALTSIARLRSGLTDVQTLSAYHALRVQYRDHAAPTAEQWDQFIAETRRVVNSGADLTAARRRSLLERLERAAGEGERIDGATFAALTRITTVTDMQNERLTWALRGVASTLDEPYESVLGRYRAMATEIDHSRGAAAPAGYDDDAVAGARAGMLPIDRGSISALASLRAQAREVMAQRALTGPQRIERTAYPEGPIAEAGYDPSGGRLEVRYRSLGTPTAVHAYQGVPQHVWQSMATAATPNARALAMLEVRNSDQYRYPTQVDADLDSAARQCTDCGQFASASHACPVRAERAARERAAHEATLAARAAATAAARQAADAQRETLNTTPEVSEDRGEPRHYNAAWRRRLAARLTNLRGGQAAGDTARMPGAYDSVYVPPNLTDMRAAAVGGPITFPVAYGGIRQGWEQEVREGDLPQGRFAVRAEAVYDRPARGQHAVSLRNPRCNCVAYAENGDCPHLGYATDRLRAAMLPTQTTASSRPRVDPAIVQAAAEAAMQQDWMRATAGAAEAAASWAPSAPEDTYSTNFSAFQDDIDAALARKAAGGEAVPYLTENALGGLADPGSGRRFGVELEFDLPAEGRTAALAAIGEELHAAGLTPGPRQAYYHSDRTTYFTHQGGWKYEQDCTVSGEIVSPAMEDTPETWANIATVCDIVKRHGGKASVRTGSHVHVSAPNATSESMTELLRMTTQHEDVIYRLSQDPARGKHRPTRWCGPNRSVPPTGYDTIYEARAAAYGHNIGVNLQSVTGEEGDHAEIRHWDGTLNPAIVQAQIKMSMAMVAAAERNGVQGATTVREKEPLGSHHRRVAALRGGSRRNLTREELTEDSATTRSFIDTLFHRREDKAQMAALFAITKWNAAS